MASVNTAMRRPQDTATRDRRRLDGRWRFRVDVDGVGRDERWFAGALREAQDMAVPASYDDLVRAARTCHVYQCECSPCRP